MQFPFFVSKLVQLDEKNIAVINGRNLPSQFGGYLNSNRTNFGSGNSKQQADSLAMVIDSLGEKSAFVKNIDTH